VAAKRIFLGIDSHSNLAIALEPTCDGVYDLLISEGARGSLVCRFAISEKALEGVLQNQPVHVDCNAGQLDINSQGDQIAFQFRRESDEEPSSCALSVSSFLKVLRVAHNRAYAS